MRKKEFNWELELIVKPALKETAKVFLMLFLFIWLVISTIVYIAWWLLENAFNTLPEVSISGSLGIGLIIFFILSIRK